MSSPNHNLFTAPACFGKLCDARDEAMSNIQLKEKLEYYSNEKLEYYPIL